MAASMSYPMFLNKDPYGPMSQPQPQPGGSPAVVPGSTDDQTQALNIHNSARRDTSQSTGHPRTDLVWDDGLASQARQWAEYLASQGQGYQHSSPEQHPNQDKTLYWTSGFEGNMRDASDNWAQEKYNHHGEKSPEGAFES
ncbi:MAG: hypothetical protein Q9166_008024 [cf. Caloplaca sp. 2 TL-2023]